MAEENYQFCCLVENDRSLFNVSISPTESIYELQKLIQKERHLRCWPVDVTLVKVNVDVSMNQDIILSGKFQPQDNDASLFEMDTVSEIWSMNPPDGFLNVFVRLPSTCNKLPCGFSGDKAFFVLGGKIEPLEIDGAARSQVAIKPCAESQSRVTFLREALEDFRLSPGF